MEGKYAVTTASQPHGSANRDLLSNSFTRRYNVRYPFACAGLAFAGMSPPLPIAVCEAGGIGAFGAGKLPVPGIAAAMDAIGAATAGTVNLNFITIFTEDAHIAYCEECPPDVVSFHWGHPPAAWIARLKAAGIAVWEQVGSIEAARLAVADGMDAVIVQGSESGGHNYGTLPLFALLPAVADAIADRDEGVHIMAAGAISDGRGVAASMALGADAVWVGTRMIATQEADISRRYKEKLVEIRGHQFRAQRAVRSRSSRLQPDARLGE